LYKKDIMPFDFEFTIEEGGCLGLAPIRKGEIKMI
jgi:hypothetical protein